MRLITTAVKVLSQLFLAAALLAGVGPQAGAADHFVDSLSTNPVAPFDSWTTAAHTIQDAIDAAQAGDVVWVTNGVYSTGGKAVHGLMTNRVAIDKAITLRSVNGPQVTLIVGAPASDGELGEGAIRCAYVGTNAVLSGFTLTNGYTMIYVGGDSELSGGGAWCESSALVSNCVSAGNSAYLAGGGVFGGTLVCCRLVGNFAGNYGGGSASSTLYNCWISGNRTPLMGGGTYRGILNNCVVWTNSGWFGGGSCIATLNNCTLIGNSARFGGGSYEGILKNCIVYFNSGYANQNYDNSTITYSCTSPLPAGAGNLAVDPLFLNQLAGDFRLSRRSPCIDSGNDSLVQPGWLDLAGNPRSQGDRVDMGAFEFVPLMAAAPIFQQQFTSPDIMRITILGTETNLLYRLGYKTNVASTNWEHFDTIWFYGNGTNMILSDYTATNQSRFYRIEAREW